MGTEMSCVSVSKKIYKLAPIDVSVRNAGEAPEHISTNHISKKNWAKTQFDIKIIIDMKHYYWCDSMYLCITPKEATSFFFIFGETHK